MAAPILLLLECSPDLVVPQTISQVASGIPSAAPAGAGGGSTRRPPANSRVHERRYRGDARFVGANESIQTKSSLMNNSRSERGELFWPTFRCQSRFLIGLYLIACDCQSNVSLRRQL